MDNKDVKQPLSKFNLSNEIKTSFELGQVVPIFWRDTVPGDIFRNNTNLTVRFMPLIAPVMHKLDVHVHFYFVPYRLLDKNYRDIVSKPESSLVSKSLFDLNIPADIKILSQDNLLRAFGIHSSDGRLPKDAQKLISQYFLRAYHLIYNYYYRHELLDDDYIDDMTSVDLDAMGLDLLKIGYARHGLDYFMTSLPSTQYGSMVELDMDGNGQIRVDEMRLAEKLQYFKERLFTKARGRYKNFLDTFFGVSPTNMELQMPKYLGGNSQILNVLDVDQTASYSVGDSISPLGSQAGKVNSDRYGFSFSNYTCEEHGIIMGLAYVLPRANYIGGIPREFIKPDFYSFYNPTFANLGMQETFGCELSAERKDTFGYNERYAELKYSKDVIAGDFTALSSWHFGIDLRQEQLSKDFVHVKTDNQPFAVQSYKESELDSFNRFDIRVGKFHDTLNDVWHFVFVKSNSWSPSYEALIKSNLSKALIGDAHSDKGTITFEGFFTYAFKKHSDTVYLFYSVGSELVMPGYDWYFPASLMKYEDNGNVLFSYAAYGMHNDTSDQIYLDSDDPELKRVVVNGSDVTFIGSTTVVGNHILLQAYNQCDALRPIPKLAKPSISL